MIGSIFWSELQLFCKLLAIWPKSSGLLILVFYGCSWKAYLLTDRKLSSAFVLLGERNTNIEFLWSLGLSVTTVSIVCISELENSR